MDAVTIGSNGAKATADDAIKVHISSTEVPPQPELNWLLILAEILAGTITTYAATA